MAEFYLAPVTMAGWAVRPGRRSRPGPMAACRAGTRNASPAWVVQT